MKKVNLISMLTMLAIMGLFQVNSNAQDTIVQWTFPIEDGTADGGVIPSNLERVIETAGGTSEIVFKNGATTKAARATAWHGGADEKKWRVDFETTAYGNIKLSSKVSAGGEDGGPRDFKVQYKVENGDWTDVENSNFQTANDWEAGVLFELPLPEECNNQSLVKIRWIMTSDTAVDGTILDENGLSKIDDIFVTGELIDATDEIDAALQVRVFPNPCNNYVNIESVSSVHIDIYNVQGKHVFRVESKGEKTIDVSEFDAGTYLFRIENLEKQTLISKTVVIQ